MLLRNMRKAGGANAEIYGYGAASPNKKALEFKELFRNGKGFCEPHFSQLLARAQVCLSAKEKSAFIYEVVQIQGAQSGTAGRRSGMVYQKFDYQNKDKPWGGAQGQHSPQH